MQKEDGNINLLKKFILAVDSFFNDDTTYYAASLSFFTIFSILPIIALAIAIISNFPEFHAYMNTFTIYLFNFINPTHSKDIIEALENYISNSNKLGFLGIIYMIFVFVMFFKDYDYIVNKIHETVRRPVILSFFIYSLFFIIFPLFFVILTFVLSFLENDFLRNFISFIFTWFIFFSLFKLSANKKIANYAALISSFFTLAVLSISKNLFIYYVIYNKTYTTIYGSLATLLFTFFWIYVSWIIYLYGIKMCHKIDSKMKKS